MKPRLGLQLDVAARVLARGGVVAHATEGVWGLACDPFVDAAVDRVLEIKRRRVEKGLIVIAGSAADFAPELDALDRATREAVLASWPGAETWIVPNVRFSKRVTGAHAGVAIRVPDHAQARCLARRFGGPLVSTSANVSNLPAARTELQARLRVGRRVDYVLPGVTGGRRGPSRIRVAGSGAVVR